MGKSKKRERERAKQDLLSLDGSGAVAVPTLEAAVEPRKIAKLSFERCKAASELRGGANVIESNGKTCTHEVAWPPLDADAAAPSGAGCWHPGAGHHTPWSSPHIAVQICALFQLPTHFGCIRGTQSINMAAHGHRYAPSKYGYPPLGQATSAWLLPPPPPPGGV